MTPEPDTGFAARCRALCPGFRASETLPARKSEVLAGDIDGVPVIAKRLARPNVVWAWYFAREVAIYRAFAASPPPVRVPAVHAIADDVLVIERLPGAPIATRRSPRAIVDAGVLSALLALPARLATTALPAGPEAPAAVRSQLRARFLEDPTAPVAWVTEGIARAARRTLLSPAVAVAMIDAIARHAAVATSHGDLLLRNAIADGTRIGLVDWECAGAHLAEWDLALLWTQLDATQRVVVEVGRSPAFLPLVAFALAREVSFLHAYRAPRHASVATLQRELDEVASRLG